MSTLKPNVLDDFKAIFQLAGIKASKWHEIKNQYWPDGPNYDDIRTPWYLAQTEHGLIKIGWRKRVIQIDWEDTKVRKIVTNDEVTKDDTSVHAWTYYKAVEYMADWMDELRAINRRIKADESEA